MLHRQRNRAALRRRAWMTVAVAALGVSVPIAAVGIADAAPIEVAAVSAPVGTQQTPPPPPRPVVRQDPAPLRGVRAVVEGTIVDQLGGVIPGADVSLTDIQSRAVMSTQSNAEGRFSFRDVPPSRYELSIRLPGFRTVTEKLTLTSGAVFRRAITLPLGTLSESISVNCQAPVSALKLRFLPVLHAQEKPPVVVRVGGSVRAPRKTKDVKPVCPSDAPAGEFTIELTGQIEKDGTIQKLALAGAAPPKTLVEAAMTAVRQWVFSPTLLNGVPVEVDITVRIVFTRK